MKRALILLLVGCGGSSMHTTPDGPTVDGQAPTGPVVVMETSMGNMVVQLDDVHEPITSANFLHYVDEHWYDGTIIHRVVNDWVIQGGGYTSGLQPKNADQPAITLETSTFDSHINGAISMARTSDPNSATTQWFIVDWPTTGTPPQPGQLDGHYAAFGVLIEGFDVLQNISMVQTTTQGGLMDVPVTQIVVTRMYRR